MVKSWREKLEKEWRFKQPFRVKEFKKSLKKL